MTAAAGTFAVAIPTRDRPEKLRWCLEALARAQERARCTVYVLDSSTTRERRDAVAAVCADFGFTELRFHDGPNLAAARNRCAQAGPEPLIVNVDDDIQVEPEAIRRLVDAYADGSGPRVVAGSVSWSGVWSRPVRLSRLGWGREARPGEDPDFLIGALFAYPKALALAFPWHERRLPGPRRGVSDDRYIGALWRRKGVALLYEPRARAVHHHEHTPYGLPDLAAHVYTNLVQGMVGSRSLRRTAGFEVLGFLRGAKDLRRPGAMRTFLASWVAAHRAFVADRRYLEELVRRELPPGL
jgi:glycosyltransferase involved in cell wall biosynthesis